MIDALERRWQIDDTLVGAEPSVRGLSYH